MGIVFKSDACEVLLECDIVAHGERCARKAWFACGSYAGSLQLALASGWTERKGACLCPRCAGRVAPIIKAAAPKVA